MADPIFSIIYSDDEIRSRLQELQRRLRDLTPVMKNIGEMLLLSTDQRFETETGVDGLPWLPNSPRTEAQKRAQGRINKILQNTGRLRASVTYVATSDRVIVGTNVAYAAKPQKGIGQPKREYLGISQEDRRNIIVFLDSYLSVDN